MEPNDSNEWVIPQHKIMKKLDLMELRIMKLSSELNEYKEGFEKQNILMEVMHNNIKSVDYKKNLDEFIGIIQNVNKEFPSIIESCNIDSLRINLCKLLYYVNKMGSYIGVNLDESFRIVHESNMSKVCETEELAKETVAWYLANDDRYKTPNYRESEYGWVVYNEFTGKILKSIKYTPADFTTLL